MNHLHMHDTDIRFNELIGKLRERDFRLTPQRIALLRLIAASDGHPSASQFYDQVRQQFPTMSQATVYKTLALLKELGEVLEIDFRDDSRYDGNKPYPHPHLICLNCNRIVDGDNLQTQTMIHELERLSGFEIVSHQLAFFGKCPECRSKG